MMADAFDKQTARDLGMQVEQELMALASRRGLKVHYVGGALDGSRFTMKLDFDIAGIDKNAEDFKKHALSVGLQLDDLGKEVKLGGRRYVIAGLKTTGKGSQSAPVLATEVASGKQYLLKIGQVKMALGREVSDWEKGL